MSRTTTTNVVLSSIALLIAIGGFVFMVYEVKNKERVLQDQLAALSAERSRDEAFYRLQRIAEESADDRQALAQHFIETESDSIDVLNWIESLAPKAGVNLETKNLQKVFEKETKKEWIEVSFTFSGQQADVERFIEILERLPYLSYITTLDYAAPSLDNWEANITMRIFIFGYD